MNLKDLDLKELILIGLTLVVSFLIGLALLGSLSKPIVQSQLQLYQTNLVLQASQWQGLQTQGKTQQAVLGGNPLDDAVKAYTKVKTTVESSLQSKTAQSEPAQSKAAPSESSAIANLRTQQNQLDLNLGLLYTQTNRTETALALWQQLIDRSQGDPKQTVSIEMAQILQGLWSEPPRLLPDEEQQVNAHLSGWFRYQALNRLYQLQQRQDALLALEDVTQARAQTALTQLLTVSLLPALGGLLGTVILVTWGIRSWFGRRPVDSSLRTESPEVLANPSLAAEQVNSPPKMSSRASSDTLAPTTAIPWDGATIWQVMVLWFTAFFAVSGLVRPLAVEFLGVNSSSNNIRVQALLSGGTYALLMAVGFGILYFSLRSFWPQLGRLPWRWGDRWFLWGLGGYFAAIPLVLVVSLINQRLLQNQGGGNPILEVIINSQDNLTLWILFFTVSVMAPLFEETLFRGFFLTSLTRYFSPWQAITLSGVVFAIAHLSVSDILPLTVLGMMLGYVYLRSGNLLSSMLLHSIWNSGSFIGLLILGGGASQ
jgi:uncharacterized protein